MLCWLWGVRVGVVGVFLLGLFMESPVHRQAEVQPAIEPINRGGVGRREQ